MKPIRVVPFLLLAIACSFAAQGQDEYLIRRTQAANTVEKFKVAMTSKMNMGAEGQSETMEVNGTMDFDLSTAAIDDKGVAEVELKTSNMKFESEGPGAEMMGGDAIPKEIVMKGKLDDRYRLTDVKSVGPASQTQMMMSMGGSGSSAFFFELPEKAVKVGDTWKVVLPANPFMGEKEHALTAKLVGLKDVDGESAFEIHIEGTIELDVDLAEAMKKAGEAGGEAGGFGDMFASMGMKMKGKMDYDTTQILARKDGRLLDVTAKMASKMQMELSGAGLTIDMDGTTTLKMSPRKD